MISRIFRIYSILRISWIYRIFSISRISRTLRTTGKFIKNIGYLTKDNIFQKHITLDIWIEGYIWYGRVTSFCKSLNLLNFVTSWKPKILISRYLWSYVWIIRLLLLSFNPGQLSILIAFQKHKSLDIWIFGYIHKDTLYPYLNFIIKDIRVYLGYLDI